MNEWRSVALFVFSFIATSALLIMTDYGFLQSPSHSDQLDDPRILTQYEFADNTFLNYRTDDDQGLKVVVTIRKGTMERFLNQAISLMRFPNVSIAAICEDPEDSIFLKRAGFPVIYDTISIQTARFYVRRTDCTTGDQATQVRQAGLVMTKIQYYKKLLNQRRSFFATDAATVWTKSPSTIIAGRQSVHGLVLGIDTDVQKGPDHNLMQVVKSARPVRFAFFRAGRAVRRETFPKLYAFSLLNLCSYSTAENMILAELAIENLRWSYNEKAHFLYSKTPNMTVSSFSGDIYFNGCEQRASRQDNLH
eukprot:TRINITY_DN10378_c0_g3_i3.p1 TRINITY_DN10378_c0_g3~~TRINITY_DN10378_c0_g3_i3.p1  ORF type:complete len:307 (+),score=64.96 TRINITY_DN10378_c0_g3_i3:48-968(+)